jgi:hypothetical protein
MEVNIGISMLKEFEVENNIRYTGHTTITLLSLVNDEVQRIHENSTSA